MSSRFLPKTAEDGSYRHVLRLVVPMVLSNAAFTVMQFTDRILVARCSSEAIQAAMPAGILTFCLMSLFTATAGYAGTFVAQFHGAGDRRACLRACTSGVILTLLFLPFFALLFPVCSALLRLAARDAALFDLENRYAFWMLPCAAAFLLLPGPLLGAFRSPDAPYTVAQMTSLGRLLLAMLAAWGMFDTMNLVYLGTLKGAGDTRFVMAWLLGTEWLVFVPCVAVALLATGAGIVGAWVVQLGYIVLLSAGLHVRWKRGRWMSIDLVHPVP
ncbi:MAG: hypothetical protein IJ678_05880 [Kiritimatiellae bacterium]|nr:hypothetical protein [Kiritimatiellia bacterium]